MSEFQPVNNMEILLRNIIQDKNTLSWSFYTPLASAHLWIIVRNYPELDGSGEIAPAGKNPELCVFHSGDVSFVGIYTASMRVDEIFAQWELSPHQWTAVSAPGYQLLRFVGDQHEIWINAGLKGRQYHLDPDMVEILLSRPEPPPDPVPGRHLPPIAGPALEKPLEPLRAFLASQPSVRAVWLFREKSPAAAVERYQIGLLMQDPEDKSLLEQVATIAKAVTPLSMNTEWVPSNLMADDRSLRNLIKERQPFYTAPDFLKK